VPFRTQLASYIAEQAKPVEKYGHQPRLYALTLQVGAGREYDDDVVYAAAWLHDLGVFTGHRPEDPDALARWDNVAYAVAKAPEVLERVGFPDEKIPAAVEAIRTHQPSGRPATLEGLILRDADILEQLGATGVLRQVCKVGRDTRYPSFTQAVAALRKSVAELPGQLQLETSRALAKPRIRIVEDFLAAVDKEAGANLF
jgi:uncharacterized protein